MAEITTLLAAARAGEASAVGRLVELLYPELQRLARARLYQASARPQLDTAALVHEVYLRLLTLSRLDVNDRAHFMTYAARVMRSVIVDLARESLAECRGGPDARWVTLDTAASQPLPSGRDEVIAVHDALLALEEVDARLARVVEMRYFVGLDNTEIAQALGVGLRTVERDWEKARSFLFAQLKAG